MALRNYKILVAFLILLCGFFAIAFWRASWHATYAKWDVRDARLAVSYFQAARNRALNSPPPEAATCLGEIVTHRSGWKWKRPDLHLGEMVESSRESAIRDVIAHLKTETGEDLGDTPASWVEKYGGAR